jgi:hypothetical protein
LGHDRDNQTPPVPLILESHETGPDQSPLVDASVVTPEYFHLLGITRLRGRLLSDCDNENAPEVAVINETMAQTYWPNEDRVGKHLKLSPSDPSWATVVGIIADARTESLENARVPEIYTSLYQKVSRRVAHHLAIFLRGNVDAAAVLDQVRAQVQSVDPTLPVFGAETLNETVSASLAQRRFLMEIVALFALTALLLAALGIYGVISYIVSERTHEIGIRIALGAERRSILLIGADHMRAGDTKSAVEVFKLNLLAYPDSADAHSDLAGAYLRDGQKDLARQYAEKTLAMSDSHTAPASSWSDTEQRRGEIHRGAQKIVKKLGER